MRIRFISQAHKPYGKDLKNDEFNLFTGVRNVGKDIKICKRIS